MDLTQELVAKILKINFTKKWPRISLVNLWKKYVKADLCSLLSTEKLAALAKDRGYETKQATWEQIFYQIYFNEVESHFDASPFFLIDFPSRISSLAKPQEKCLGLAERFELIINKIELADGNTENFDYHNIEKMMIKESKQRLIPYDQGFINALKNLAGQLWAGVGIGVDRLAMLSGEFSSINDIQHV